MKQKLQNELPQMAIYLGVTIFCLPFFAPFERGMTDISQQDRGSVGSYGVGTDTCTSFEFPLVPFAFTAWTT
jgi:hypothetical protein